MMNNYRDKSYPNGHFHSCIIKRELHWTQNEPQICVVLFQLGELHVGKAMENIATSVRSKKHIRVLISFLFTITDEKLQELKHDNYSSAVHTNPENDSTHPLPTRNARFAHYFTCSRQEHFVPLPSRPQNAEYYALCIIHTMRYDEYNRASL
jgi:hypothetical protein